MKRDPRLHGLSAEHHHALVLARRLSAVASADDWDRGAVDAFGARFDAELEPHFRLEERVLLPALRLAGEPALVERTELDHAYLRDRAAAARTGDRAAARAFAGRLREHVRFEETELFPCCEARLPAAVLDEVGRLRPNDGSAGRGER